MFFWWRTLIVVVYLPVCMVLFCLQTPEERSLIKGIIINKFRGDIRLFESGIKMIEDLCKVPVLGVVPLL